MSMSMGVCVCVCARACACVLRLTAPSPPFAAPILMRQVCRSGAHGLQSVQEAVEAHRRRKRADVRFVGIMDSIKVRPGWRVEGEGVVLFYFELRFGWSDAESRDIRSD